MGPVLPYDTSAVQCIELKNPMDCSIEVFSQDFDTQYLDEEEILKRLDQFLIIDPKVQPDPMFLEMRAPGGQFWPSLREQDDRRKRTEEMKEQVANIETTLAQLAKDEENVGKEQEGEGEPPLT